VPAVRAGFDTARPNRACDDGIKGQLAETQTDASRRTTLGARTGLQWAGHLDHLNIFLADRLDQLHFLSNRGFFFVVWVVQGYSAVHECGSFNALRVLMVPPFFPCWLIC
jgi:hypothetical protein